MDKPTAIAIIKTLAATAPMDWDNRVKAVEAVLYLVDELEKAESK